MQRGGMLRQAGAPPGCCGSGECDACAFQQMAILLGRPGPSGELASGNNNIRRNREDHLGPVEIRLYERA